MQKIRILAGDDAQVTTFSFGVLRAISAATGGVAGTIAEVVKEKLREKAGNYPEGELLSRSEKRLYDLYHAFGGDAKDWNRWYAEFRDAGYDHPKVRAYLKDGTLELDHLDIRP